MSWWTCRMDQLATVSLGCQEQPPAVRGHRTSKFWWEQEDGIFVLWAAQCQGQVEGPARGLWPPGILMKKSAQRRMRMVWDMSSLSLSQLPWMENVVSYLDQYHCPFLRDPMQMLSYTCSVVNRNRAIKLRPQNCPKRWLWYWKAQLLPNSPSDILIIRSCLCWWIFRTRLRRQKHKAWVGS